MRLTNLILEHFRLFEELKVDFPSSNAIAIIGNNGAGKTSILDAVAICLTHLTGELLSRDESYNIDAWFQNDDITNNFNKGKCNVTVKNLFNAEKTESYFQIEVIKKKYEPGLKFNKKPDNFIKRIKEKLENDIVNTIPIIAYYNVNRTSELYSDTIKKSKTYNDKLFAYERALSLNSPNFKSFESWFLNQKARENAFKVKEGKLDAELPSLKNIRKALNEFIGLIEPNRFVNLQVKQEQKRNTDFSEDFIEYLSIEKDGVEIKFSQFSHGERMVISLVCEVARRLTIANEHSSNALQGEGVVLIDELELHLHPRWQNSIVKALTQVFPKIQFIFTTHSPLIVSGLRRENILIFNNGQLIPNDELPDIFSASANEILQKLMFSNISSVDFSKEREEINMLFNGLKFDEAEAKLLALKNKIDSNPSWLNDYEQKLAFVKS